MNDFQKVQAVYDVIKVRGKNETPPPGLGGIWTPGAVFTFRDVKVTMDEAGYEFSIFMAGIISCYSRHFDQTVHYSFGNSKTLQQVLDLVEEP